MPLYDTHFDPAVFPVPAELLAALERNGFSDVSYGNDVCPRFTAPVDSLSEVCLWTHALLPRDREMGGARFVLATEDDEGREIWQTEDVAEAIARLDGTYVEKAAPPAPPIFVEKLLRGLVRLDRRPRFSKAHEVKGIRGSDGATKWIEPDGVYATGRHLIVRGRVPIRIVPSEQAEALRAIDAERQLLKKRSVELTILERSIIQAAWDASKDMTAREIKEGQDK